MTSITGRKRCGCGQYKPVHDNGTLTRHTKAAMGPGGYDTRVRCQWSGKFPPAVAKMREETNARDLRQHRKPTYANAQVDVEPDRVRGGKRAAKRNAAAKARYRRNSAGGYNR